ncbi:MAG: hypothetical protein JKY67_17410, partial [Pseudomonadales bacterium]|nr:hypothetical protein [Pseudomonadales bacterium]
MNLDFAHQLFFSRFVIGFFGSLLFTGCALFTPASNDLFSPLPSEGITHWKLKGKIGIRTKEDGGSAHIRWLQHDDGYELSLSGPLGQGAAT